LWLWTFVAVTIWVALAFWPARVAARKGHSFFGYFTLQPDLLPRGTDRRVHGLRSDRDGPERG
jgi:hypothetical protein